MPKPAWNWRRILVGAGAGCLLLVAAAVWLGWHFLYGPHVYNGRTVTRRVEWYAERWFIPIPTGPLSVSYGYTDETGSWVREGPATEYYPNRNVRFRGYYLAGKLDGNESIFNEAGIETLRIFWKDGQQVSSLRCPCVSP